MQQIKALFAEHGLELKFGESEYEHEEVAHWRTIPEFGTYPIVDQEGRFKPTLPTVLQALERTLTTRTVVKAMAFLNLITIDHGSDLAPSELPPLIKLRVHFHLTLNTTRIIIVKAGAVGPTEEAVRAYLDGQLIVNGAATANQAQQAIVAAMRRRCS